METACSINQVSTNVQLNNDTINFVIKTTDLKMRKIADVFCNWQQKTVSHYWSGPMKTTQEVEEELNVNHLQIVQHLSKWKIKKDRQMHVTWAERKKKCHSTQCSFYVTKMNCSLTRLWHVTKMDSIQQLIMTAPKWNTKILLQTKAT